MYGVTLHSRAVSPALFVILLAATALAVFYAVPARTAGQSQRQRRATQRPVPARPPEGGKDVEEKEGESDTLAFGTGARRFNLKLPEGWEVVPEEEGADSAPPFPVPIDPGMFESKTIRYEIPGARAEITLIRVTSPQVTEAQMKKAVSDAFTMASSAMPDFQAVGDNQPQGAAGAGERFTFEYSEQYGRRRQVFMVYHPRASGRTALLLSGNARSPSMVKYLESAIEFLLTQ